MIAVSYVAVPARATWGSSPRVAGAASSDRAETLSAGSATFRLGYPSISGRHIRTQGLLCVCVLVFFRLWFSSYGPAVSDPFRPAEPNDKVALGGVKRQAAAAQRRDATAPVELSVEQLMAMRVPELRRWAKQCGVSGYSKLRKHELASLLAAQQSVAQEPLEDLAVSMDGPHASTHRTRANLAQPQPQLEAEPSAAWPPSNLEGGSSTTATATATAAGGYRPPDSTSFQSPQRPLTRKRSMPKWRRKGPADWECPAWFAKKLTAVIENYPAGLYLDVLPHVYERFHGEPLPSHSMFGFAQETAFYQYGMDQYCRLNKSRRKIHPLKFGDMSDDEVLLKRMLEDLQRHDARALTEAENEMFFRAMQHYTREFMELWAWRYAVKGKLLMNFLEEFSSMHGLLFSAKHCGLKTSLQLVRAMPELLVVHKVNKTTRLTRVYPAPPLIPLLKAKALDRLERQKAQGGLVVGIDDNRDEWADDDDGKEQQQEEEVEEEAEEARADAERRVRDPWLKGRYL